MKTTDLLVLAVLGDGPQHGYGLAQAIAERTRQLVQIRAADLYRVLYRMHAAGLIEEVPPRSRPAGPRAPIDERRTYYRITMLGRRAAREQAEMLSDVCASVLGRRREVLP